MTPKKRLLYNKTYEMLEKDKYCTINCRLSQKANINLFFNEFDDRINGRFVENTMFCELFDLSATQCICSIHHNLFNQYMFNLSTNAYIENKPSSKVTNDKTTDKTILFYVVFERLPNEVTFDNEYEYGVSSKEVDSLIYSIRNVVSLYPNATVKVISNIFKFYTSHANKNDMLFKQINALQNEKVRVDTEYNMNNIDPSEVAFIVTNKMTYLFSVSVDKKIPLILTSYESINEESYLNMYFNSLSASEFILYDNCNEFKSFLCDSHFDDECFHNVCMLSMKMNDQYKYMTKEFFMEDTVTMDTIKKLVLYDKANIYQNLFNTEANEKLLSKGFDINDKESLVVTVLHHQFGQRAFEQPRWLGLDGDNFIHKDKEAVSLRYYYKSYHNSQPLYTFTSVQQIVDKFGLGEVKDMSINESGVIWLFLDNPFGRNYDNLEAWVSCWKNILTKLVNMDLKNRIYIRPYSYNDDVDKVYFENFKDYNNYVVYDKESAKRDLLDVLDSSNIYFCIKRQGPYFGKCFTRGKLMLSALTENETKLKNDFALLKQYEYNFNTLTSSNIKSKLKEMSTHYLLKKLEVLKIITSYLVTKEDLKNGTFLKTLLNK